VTGVTVRSLVIAAAVTWAVGVAVTGQSGAKPRCFGAASRDPVHPCRNPALRFSVVPTPSEALLMPTSPCTPLPRSGPPEVCEFGVPRARAVKTIALIGDSHAAHWRAALDVVARAKRWRGLSVYHTQCPFTMAVPVRKRMRSACVPWRRQVLRWLARHPRVDTIVVSQRSGGRVRLRPREHPFAAKVAGYVDAWNALPESIAHVIVVRDVPYSEVTTPGCVARAMGRHRPAGRVCALPRETSLRPDPAMAAVTALASRRVQGVDMTRFMCGRRWCFPVVGGALVRKDVGHLTRVFSESLGPFLLRRINRLSAGRSA
jgi:SGNH domain-containing protein